MNRFITGLAAIVAACSVSACAVEKSSNPLSPSVAGPIPGVNVTAPTPVAPAVGARIAVGDQPITLTVQNASTNGVRPLSYVFEVALDAGFTNVLLTRGGVTPGADGRTSLKLSDPLATGRTYYWHSRAEDGANTGAFSAPAPFSVFTPIVIQAPTLVSPVAMQKVDSLQPKLIWTNAARSGPVGQIQYVIEISDTSTFARKLAVWTVDETANQTSLLAPSALANATTYFWRVLASDPTTAGPFSNIEAFITPDATPVGIGGGGGGGGGTAGSSCTSNVASDGINMSAAGIYNSPLDLARWCVGARITSVQFTSGAFLVDFSRRDGPNRWPDYISPGFTGPLQYTLGMCLQVNGQWACSAVVEFWYGRPLTESAAPSAIAREWFYDPRWGPLTGRQPADGETVGIFVCSGDCRNTTASYNPNFKERSNIVMVKWSNGGGPSYTF